MENIHTHTRSIGQRYEDRVPHCSPFKLSWLYQNTRKGAFAKVRFRSTDWSPLTYILPLSVPGCDGVWQSGDTFPIGAQWSAPFPSGAWHLMEIFSASAIKVVVIVVVVRDAIGSSSVAEARTLNAAETLEIRSIPWIKQKQHNNGVNMKEG